MSAAYLGGTNRETVDRAAKRFANARAKLALAAYQLHVVDDGHGGSMYLVQRWDRSRRLADLEAVEAFIAQVVGDKG